MVAIAVELIDGAAEAVQFAKQRRKLWKVRHWSLSRGKMSLPGLYTVRVSNPQCSQQTPAVSADPALEILESEQLIGFGFTAAGSRLAHAHAYGC